MDFRLPCLDKSNWKSYTRKKPVMKREAQNIATQCRATLPHPHRRRFALLIAFALMALPSRARASFLHGETLDAVAGAIAWFAFIIVPPVLIVAFLAVHILPEKVAEKRHHPQLGAIKCLCFLSLVFGGLLWPFAWLWAYSKPVLHKMAYGTDVDHSHDEAAGEKPASSELEQLRARVAELEAENKGGKA
jgi:CBS domain containing-hemolysin-like protein